MGSLIVAGLVATSLLSAFPAAAACSPRTASSLGPVPVAGPIVEPTAPGEPTIPGEPVNPTEPPAEPLPLVEPAPAPVSRCSYVRPIEFPVVANGVFLSSFGVPRDGGARWHHGVDIAAPAMTPVVAVGDGVISAIHAEAGDCCWVSVEHPDRWLSMYVHLTNDTPGTDDGSWAGIRPDLAVGDAIRAGELIGWVGDSGNAEPGEPHLHFELRTPGGEPIDPYPSLRAAADRAPLALTPTDGALPAEADGVIVTGRPAFAGPFLDDEEVPRAEMMFTALLMAGAKAWCDPWGLRTCPQEPVQSLDARNWITVLAGDPIPDLPAEPGTPGLDEACGPITACVAAPVTWAEVAAMTLGAGNGQAYGPAEAFAALGHQLGGCSVLNPDDRPTRLHLAIALLRYFERVDAPPCTTLS
jgi:hypothetical protein